MKLTALTKKDHEGHNVDKHDDGFHSAVVGFGLRVAIALPKLTGLDGWKIILAVETLTAVKEVWAAIATVAIVSSVFALKIVQRVRREYVRLG